MGARMVQGYLNHVIVEDDCPKCGDPTAIDMGMIELSELPQACELGCDDCQVEWTVTLRVVLEPLKEDSLEPDKPFE